MYMYTMYTYIYFFLIYIYTYIYTCIKYICIYRQSLTHTHTHTHTYTCIRLHLDMHTSCMFHQSCFELRSTHVLAPAPGEVNEKPVRHCTLPHCGAVSESNSKKDLVGARALLAAVLAHLHSLITWNHPCALQGSCCNGSLTTRCRRSRCSHQELCPER